MKWYMGEGIFFFKKKSLLQKVPTLFFFRLSMRDRVCYDKFSSKPYFSTKKKSKLDRVLRVFGQGNGKGESGEGGEREKEENK